MATVGKSLQRAKKQKAVAARAMYVSLVQAQQALHDPKVEHAAKKLKSIWETSNMDEFLSIADERENGYTAERNVKVVVDGKVHVFSKAGRIVPQSDERDWFMLSEQLTIPKRPAWTYDMAAAEVQRMEKAAFLEWRRSLAAVEESLKVTMTPYEKNLEVWRQLWRVVERSDLVLEIVDARNPLAFRCVDFEKYVGTHTNKQGATKTFIILLNKADLLTENQRRAWSVYFTKKGLKFLFFAAKQLDKTIDHAAQELEDDKKPAAPPSDDDDDSEELLEEEAAALDEVEEEQEIDMTAAAKASKKEAKRERRLAGAPRHVNPYELLAQRKAAKDAKNAPAKAKPSRPETHEELERDHRLAEIVNNHQSWEVLQPEQLLDHLAFYRKQLLVTDIDTPLVVGMVGYPNVGKSSTINAIIGCKKVVVSATPGKTKHFQTLTIPNERRVMLCDCPGLVFPSFASTREAMICDGVLPIDTVKDYVAPVQVICQRIPRQVFEFMYKVSLSQKNDVDESTSLADRLLNVVARRKGYMTDHDKPNRSKIAKELLKLYVDGVFVFAHPPPGLQLTLPKDPTEEDPAARTKPGGKRAKTVALTAPPQERRHLHEERERDDDEEEEGTHHDDDIWEDISSADEARALSDDESETSRDDDVVEINPTFFARPSRRDEFTQAELFNYETNAAMAPKQERSRKKKKTNHQLDPDLTVRFNEATGENELAIDSDDDIVEYDSRHPRVQALLQRKPAAKKSKRSVRREMKKLGLDVPTKRTAPVVVGGGF
jgi:large subunit GTPase 1